VIILVSGNCGTWKGYDLSSLTRPSNNPYYAMEAGTVYSFYWNFCDNLQSVPPDVSNLPYSSPTIQIDTGNHIAVSVGMLANAKMSETSTGIEIVYTNSNSNDLCLDDSSGMKTLPRVSTFKIDCDKNAASGNVLSVKEPPGTRCQYFYTMTHKAVCGKGAGGLSGGSVFLIIFFCSAAVYLIAGVIFKRFKMGATGAEMIPNVEFWQSLPGLVMDGFRFVFSKFRGGGYASV